MRKGTGEIYVDFVAKNAAVYDVTVNSFSQTNYYFTPSNPAIVGGFEIEKRELAVSAWNYSIGGTTAEYTQALPYVRNQYTLTPVVNNVVAGENVALNIVNNSYTDAGTYTAVASLNASAYPNYQMTSQNKNWEIKAIEVTLSWTFDGSTSTLPPSMMVIPIE